MRSLMKYFDCLELFFYFISKLAVFLMMLTTTADAICRYLFNSPIVGAYEFVESYLMVVVVFLSLSYVMKVNGHIKVDMLVEHLPDRLVRVLNIIFLLAGALLMLVIGYQGVLATEEAWVNNYTSSGLIAWPTWLSVIWVPIGSFLFVLRLILEAIKVALMNSDDEEAANAAMGMNSDDEDAANHNVF